MGRERRRRLVSLWLASGTRGRALAGQPGLRFEDMGVTISIRSLVVAVPERVEALAEELVDVPG